MLYFYRNYQSNTVDENFELKNIEKKPTLASLPESKALTRATTLSFYLPCPKH